LSEPFFNLQTEIPLHQLNNILFLPSWKALLGLTVGRVRDKIQKQMVVFIKKTERYTYVAVENNFKGRISKLN
jgi:hypothetical protein